MRFGRRTTTILSTMLVFSTAACSAPPSTGGGSSQESAQTSNAASQPADGRTMFRGILFGQGSVADALPEVWNRPELRATHESASPQMLAAMDDIVAKIEASSPGYLDAFAKEMQSGDHLRVRAALDDASDRIMAAANVPKTAKPMCVAGPFAIALAVVYLAVVAVQYAWVDGPKPDPVKPPSGGGDPGPVCCPGQPDPDPDPEVRKLDEATQQATRKLRQAAQTEDDALAGLGRDELIDLVATRFAR